MADQVAGILCLTMFLAHTLLTRTMLYQYVAMFRIIRFGSLQMCSFVLLLLAWDHEHKVEGAGLILIDL